MGGAFLGDEFTLQERRRGGEQHHGTKSPSVGPPSSASCTSQVHPLFPESVTPCDGMSANNVVGGYPGLGWVGRAHVRLRLLVGGRDT